ncbi:hypothetical protein B0H16DRAFT_1818253 [Mycena metata]|uniref:Uncharacterized protein n=1 Tax=Mycena metata TaxID=1033252 RepID=A0AAD7K9V9_9AGAR|nr:hypothetical protein B0H16DRAFT_1818253 [Mycena metata]
MSSPSPSPSRHERQAETLEKLDDIYHELLAICMGNSPATRAFRSDASRRLDNLKRKFCGVPDGEAGPSDHNTPLTKKPRLATPRAPPPIAQNTADPNHASPPTNPPNDATPPTDKAALPNVPRPGAAAQNEETHPAHAQAKNNTVEDEKTKLTTAQARVKRVQERYANLLHNLNEEPASKEDFLHDIQNPTGGERKPQEDAAFGRILRGCGEEGCYEEWKCFLQPKFSAVDLSWISKELSGIQKRAKLNGPARMQETHLALEDAEESANKKRYVEFLVSHISVLMFGLDWRQLKGKGSRKMKIEFYESTYQKLTPHKQYFEGLSEQQRAHAMKNEHAEGYTAWRTKIEPRITARNRFVDLYLAYGPIVFLDPFWDVHALTDGARTKDFPALFTHFINNVPEDPAEAGVSVAAQRWSSSYDAVHGVARAVDRKVWKALKILLASDPDTVEEP